MTIISRILLLNSNLLKFNKGGSFVTYVTQKLLPATAHFDSYPNINIVHKTSELKTVKRFTYSKSVQKNPFIKGSLGGKLSKINLPTIVENSKNLPQGLLIATAQKLITVYHLNKATPGFQKELRFFILTQAFRKFCKILEDELPKIIPHSLPILLQLTHFSIPPDSIFMRKILTLLLDNLHCLSVIDLIDLYTELKQKHFMEVEECQHILKGCEELFETYLEEEISYITDIKDLIYLLPEKKLPLKVRQLITERCLSEINGGRYRLSYFVSFFSFAFKEPILSMYKHELIEKLKIILKENQAPNSYYVFSEIYTKGVINHDHLYNEKMCELFLSNFESFHSLDNYLLKVLNNICLMGYYKREAVDKLVEIILNSDFFYDKPQKVFNIASVFMRTSYQEMNNPNWNKIKSLLESFNPIRSFKKISDVFQFCEYLTFLGCNTVDIIRAVLERATEYDTYDTNSDYRFLLRLHHCCKKYFPDSNVGISKKALNRYLQNAVYKKNFYQLAHVHELFGSSDYVLYNCFSSNFHFLPIIAMLGPDNKPVDLSSCKLKNPEANFDRNFNVINNIDNIKKPGCKVIAFLEYPDYQPFEFRNAPITSGYLKMFLKLYEGVDYDIVLLPIKYFTFESSQKLQYLKYEIDKIIRKYETAE